MSDDEKNKELNQKDLYSILIDTRNFEIKLFWERANYFLVLNTALAVGFFNIKEACQQFFFAIVGLISAYLWWRVCLGGRFWQAKWEGTIKKYEKSNLDSVRFFSTSEDENKSDAKIGLDLKGNGEEKRKIKKWVYEYVVNKKPSVSYSMIKLSAVFVLGWGGLSLYSASEVSIVFFWFVAILYVLLIVYGFIKSKLEVT